MGSAVFRARPFGKEVAGHENRARVPWLRTLYAAAWLQREDGRGARLHLFLVCLTKPRPSNPSLPAQTCRIKRTVKGAKTRLRGARFLAKRAGAESLRNGFGYPETVPFLWGLLVITRSAYF